MSSSSSAAAELHRPYLATTTLDNNIHRRLNIFHTIIGCSFFGWWEFFSISRTSTVTKAVRLALFFLWRVSFQTFVFFFSRLIIIFYVCVIYVCESEWVREWGRGKCVCVCVQQAGVIESHNWNYLYLESIFEFSYVLRSFRLSSGYHHLSVFFPYLSSVLLSLSSYIPFPTTSY